MGTTIERRTGRVLALGPHGMHGLAYGEWGAPDNPRVLMAVHGLMRNGRDFDVIAKELAGDYRVVCPDIAGRGESDWLENKDDYSNQLFLSDLITVMARAGATEIDWIGTSMGGLLGMLLAAQKRSPIRRMVLNDIGPKIPKAALGRIVAGTEAPPESFADLDGVADHFRGVLPGLGPYTAAQWRDLASHSARQREDGRFTLIYDPAIALPVKARLESSTDMWRFWDRITCPVLVLRGSDSDIFPREIADEMLTRGPATTVVEFAGVGHAPGLANDEQIAVVKDWLLA